jgi:signal transduction histidine kinase
MTDCRVGAFPARGLQARRHRGAFFDSMNTTLTATYPATLSDPDGLATNSILGSAEGKPTASVLKTGALQNAILNSANFSSIATDENGVIQIFNVGAERMLGYAAVDVIDRITPADISDPVEVVARAKALSAELSTAITPGFEALVFKASRGIEDIYELTYIRKDGSRFPAVVSVTALRDAEGAIIGYLLIGTDNSARKRAEEALRNAGALQSAIFNSANFSSIATDEKGVIQIFNVGAERMLGYTAIEVMNKITPAQISDPQEVVARAAALSIEMDTAITPGFEALVFKASRGIEDIYELTYIRKDGSRFPAVVSVTALRSAEGGVIGYLLIGTDNSARKKAEEALVKADALQSAIFSSAYFSCIATDAHGVIQLFNVGAERMMGYSARDVVDKITPAELHDPTEVVARARALSSEFGTPIAPGFEALSFKASRGIDDIYELTKIRKDGTRFPAIVSVTALRDMRGHIIGYLLIGTDNSAGKLAEETLAKAAALKGETERLLNADLEKRVAERTVQLEEANKDLEAFSYSVSHDLRAPLRAVDGYSQVVIDEFGPQLSEKGRRYLHTIRQGAQKMGALIDDLLAFARFNRQDLVKRTFDTSSLVRTVLAELGSPWPDRKVEVCVASDLAYSMGDAVLLKQVWLNLLSNALKYTRKTPSATLEVGCSRGDGVDVFFLRDNGSGFDMRYADKLFGVFQRFHRAEDFEGTGVGLAIVQRIVHRHGGKIWAESAVDKGATFYFTLGPAKT